MKTKKNKQYNVVLEENWKNRNEREESKVKIDHKAMEELTGRLWVS